MSRHYDSGYGMGLARERNFMFKYPRTMTMVCLAASVCFGEEPAKPVTTFSGWAWLTLGRVERSYIPVKIISEPAFDAEALSNFETGLKVIAPMNVNSKFRLHAGIGMYYNIVDPLKQTDELGMRKFAPYILDATLQSTWGARGDRDTLQTETGYFPVKYNPQATNFGEYLFRSGTYPGFLVSGFELADKVKQCGIHLSYILNMESAGRLKQDLFFTNEVEQYPLHDFNLAYLLTYAPLKMIDFGVGADWAHILDIDNRGPTPGHDTLAYSSHSSNDMHYIGYVDPKNPHDTTFYTFRGIKVEGRTTIDPVWFWRPSGILGKDGGKFYFEAAILGVQNYPGWYNDISQRMPVMFGLNVPAWKILDVLSLEAEYYASRYWNSQQFIWQMRSPVPFTGDFSASYYDNWTPKNDNHWKWSVYASKKLFTKYRLSGQIASDHMSRTGYTGPAPSNISYLEMTPRTADWYYMLRAMIYF